MLPWGRGGWGRAAQCTAGRPPSATPVGATTSAAVRPHTGCILAGAVRAFPWHSWPDRRIAAGAADGCSFTMHVPGPSCRWVRRSSSCWPGRGAGQAAHQAGQQRCPRGVECDGYGSAERAIAGLFRGAQGSADGTAPVLTTCRRMWAWTPEQAAAPCPQWTSGAAASPSAKGWAGLAASTLQESQAGSSYGRWHPTAFHF